MVPTADRGVIALTSGGGARRAHRNRDSWRYSDSAVTDESVATRAIALPGLASPSGRASRHSRNRSRTARQAGGGQVVDAGGHVGPVRGEVADPLR